MREGGPIPIQNSKEGSYSNAHSVFFFFFPPFVYSRGSPVCSVDDCPQSLVLFPFQFFIVAFRRIDQKAFFFYLGALIDLILRNFLLSPQFYRQTQGCTHFAGRV